MGAVVSYLIQMAIPAFAGGLFWALTQPLRASRPAGTGAPTGKYREGVLCLFFMYMAGLLGITLTPAGFWSDILSGKLPVLPLPFQGRINLIPIKKSWIHFQYYVKYGFWDAILVNYPGNIFVFLPVGLCAGLLSDRPRWWKGMLWALGLSLFIELFQILVSRETDIDDLILNTLGGLLGYGVFLLIRRAWPDFVQNCTKQRGSD